MVDRLWTDNNVVVKNTQLWGKFCQMNWRLGYYSVSYLSRLQVGFRQYWEDVQGSRAVQPWSLQQKLRHQPTTQSVDTAQLGPKRWMSNYLRDDNKFTTVLCPAPGATTLASSATKLCMGREMVKIDLVTPWITLVLIHSNWCNNYLNSPAWPLTQGTTPAMERYWVEL